jgi:hypothetical protein
VALVARHGIAFHEKHKGQLFCDRSAEDLIEMLLREVGAGGVQRRQPCRVAAVGRGADSIYTVDGKQLRLGLAGPSVHEGDRLWEYTVLVTDEDYPLESIGQLYRDRADAENAFDELKNRWGLNGFSTQDLTRSQTVARARALGYNCWSWYCRAAHPTGRMEAITSRPLLLAAVGKAVSHANQTTLYLTPLRGRAHILKRLIANIGAALQHVRSAAEQFKDLDRRGCLLRCISVRIAPVIGPPQPPPGLPATG